MKKLSLLFAVLMAWMGFSTYAAVGDTFTASGYNFKIVKEGDVNEVEFAPRDGGAAYNIAATNAFTNLNTVTNNGVEYTIVGVGPFAFQNAQFPANGNTNMPRYIRYVSDFAFKGVKSGSSESRGSVRFYGDNLRYLSSKAFVDNNLQGSVLITSGDAENGFAQVNSTATSRYTNGQMYLAAERGTKYILFPKSYPVGNSNGWAPAYKVEINADIKTIGAYAMMNCTNYTQIDLANVEVIDTAAFMNTALNTITFPATITSVAGDAFEGNTALTRVTVNCSYNAVKDVVFDDAVYNRIGASGEIYVPAEDLETYKADPNWGRFWPAAKYAITIADGIQNGTVTADKAEAEEGEAVTLTVTPAEGYQLATLTYTVEGEAPVAIENNTFNMPAAPVTINATFEEAAPTPTTYTITIADGIQNGTVVADKAEAEEGETVTLTVTPAEGYQLNSLSVTPDMLELIVEINGNNQFEMPADNVTVNATFIEIPPTTYTITIADGIQNGTVVADKAEAEEGETVTLTITPAEGYQLEGITVTAEGIDELIVVDENNQFEMPAANVTVNATFAEIPPVVVENAINFSATVEHATIEVTVAGEPIESGALVAEGTEVTIVVTPENGYKVASLTVVEVAEPEGPAGMPRRADVPVTADGNTYTFDMPAAPININVTMEQEVTTGVADLNVSSNKGVKYVNVMGQVSDRPFNGVNIVIDGDKTYKVIK